MRGPENAQVYTMVQLAILQDKTEEIPAIEVLIDQFLQHSIHYLLLELAKQSPTVILEGIAFLQPAQLSPRLTFP